MEMTLDQPMLIEPEASAGMTAAPPTTGIDPVEPPPPFQVALPTDFDVNVLRQYAGGSPIATPP